MTSPIILATLNSSYHHCAFGLRYLYANLGELQQSASIVEFTINQNSRDIVETILARNPRIVGFGVYIWNTRQTFDVISLLKRIRPGLCVVVGGPEVSFEYSGQKIVELADYTICGEADLRFYEFCREFIVENRRPAEKVLTGPLPEIKALKLPYEYYSAEDVKQRVIYVEASRGCPYKCEFCLSSLDTSVRNFDLTVFLAAMDDLIARGAKQFKFVDRTFNLSIAYSTQILRFFLDRMSHDLFLHFELVPDRLPVELRDLIRQFPAGSIQFEIGIQTWNPDVAKLVSRRQDYAKVQENFQFLTEETGVHIHADLIAGLPGEDLKSFGRGFDALSGLNPHEIQVGILKRLKGTPIMRHDTPWEMVYEAAPPFQIISTKVMPFSEVQAINRFAKFWNFYANSGNFRKTSGYLKVLATKRDDQSIFGEFFAFTEFLDARHPQRYGIALVNLVESAWRYFEAHPHADLAVAREALVEDYTGSVKRDIPAFLRTDEITDKTNYRKLTSRLPKRQQRHMEIPLAAE